MVRVFDKTGLRINTKREAGVLHVALQLSEPT
jgi:hypothetical protein